jgi:hypothetical protein
MAGDGTLATTAIITGGLTCGHGPLDPCKSGLITTPFSLYCTGILPPPKPSAGGGGYPCDAWNKLDPGEIQNFYQPVPLEYYLVPQEQEEDYLRRYVPLKITFKMGNINIEREYSVPETKRRIVVKAFNLMDATQKQVSVAFSSIKKVASDIKFVIRNFRIRNK